MSSHPPPPPEQQLDSVAPGLWGVDYPMVLSGGFQLPTRMTVVDLGEGRLLCYSPVPLTRRVKEQIAATGNVELIIAPNCFHHFFVDQCAEAFPGAEVLGAPGLAEKRSDLHFDGVVDETYDSLWSSALDRVFVAGAPAMNETVFFHRKTRTLIVADLVFNMTQPRGLMANVVLRLMGVHKRLGQSRAWRLFFVKDRQAAAESCLQIVSWPIERIVPCHGAIYGPHDAESGVAQGEAKEALRSALAWMLSG